MKNYTVKIIETLIKEVEIEAENSNDALNKIKIKYRDSDIVLSADDLFDVEFYVND